MFSALSYFNRQSPMWHGVENVWMSRLPAVGTVIAKRKHGGSSSSGHKDEKEKGMVIHASEYGCILWRLEP
eukprot:4492739-Amphidinium_carterae.2